MKRGAEAIGRGDPAPRSDRNCNRGWERPDHKHKRMRHSEREHARNENIAVKGATVKTLADEKEEDPHRLAQRQKQIDYGKNTIGYDRYCAQVPRHQRRPGKHPMTPDKTMRIGKKGFDGIVRKWRQALHKYDPPELVEATEIVKTESNSTATSSTNSTGASDMNGEGSTTSSVSTVASTESAVKEEEKAVPVVSESVPPSRSIYENFDEDNFDQDDSDDDLL